STDAKLAWGVNLGETIPAWLWKSFAIDTEDAYDLAQALEEVGLTLEHHCSDACTMYVLCIEESVVTAWRGHPKTIVSVDVRDVWLTKWERVKRAGKPRWLLFSWWC